MKERKIRYNGLDLKVTIDTDDMIEKVRNQYRPVISEMKKIIDKRNKYISKLHDLIKSGRLLCSCLWMPYRFRGKPKSYTI